MDGTTEQNFSRSERILERNTDEKHRKMAENAMDI